MSFVDGLNLGMTAADRCRTAEMLAFYISPDHLGTLRMICRSMAFVEVKRQGTADLPRVGDRVLSPAQRQLRSLVLECVVEGVRAGIQTGFYTCNYSAKPSMTCGPVLKHMTHGMAQLEARLETEAAERQARRVLAAFPAGQAPFNVPATGEEPLKAASLKRSENVAGACVSLVDGCESSGDERQLPHEHAAVDGPGSHSNTSILAHYDEASGVGSHPI